MGENVYEGGDVVVRRVCAGRASGFPVATRAYAISTGPRAETSDYIVLDSKEALRVAMAILAGEVELSGRSYLQGLAEKIGLTIPFPSDPDPRGR